MLTTVLSDDPTSPQLLAAAEQNSNQTCIVFVSADSGEGYQIVESQRGDRNDLNLWHHGDEVIIAVAARCKDTIVVIHTVGPVVMERWIEHPNVTAVLMAGLPGQEAGESLADILYGDVNPSGRLPYTIGKSLQDYGANSQIMYTPNAAIPQQDLFDADDGLLADYRYFDRYNITPRFEFGFGLGYADFVFADVEVKVVDQGGVREFPPARGNDEASPPVLNSSLPQDRAEVLFPSGWKKIKGFVYPYLDSLPASSTAPAPVATVTASPRSPVAFSALFDVILHVTATVRNTHPTLPGKAVAQLYLRFPETKGVRFPMQVLRGFEKVGVGAGETIRVGFDLTRRDLSYWDEGVGNWRLPVDGEGRWGGYGVRVGASSRGEGWVNVGRWVVGG